MVANEMRKKKEKLARGFDDRSENFFYKWRRDKQERSTLSGPCQEVRVQR